MSFNYIAAMIAVALGLASTMPAHAAVVAEAHRTAR
jgi:hypothetical protein